MMKRKNDTRILVWFCLLVMGTANSKGFQHDAVRISVDDGYFPSLQFVRGGNAEGSARVAKTRSTVEGNAEGSAGNAWNSRKSKRNMKVSSNMIEQKIAHDVRAEGSVDDVKNGQVVLSGTAYDASAEGSAAIDERVEGFAVVSEERDASASWSQNMIKLSLAADSIVYNDNTSVGYLESFVGSDENAINQAITDEEVLLKNAVHIKVAPYEGAPKQRAVMVSFVEVDGRPTILVTYRGTANMADWQTNLSAVNGNGRVKADDKFNDAVKGYVHAGFSHRAELLWPEVEAAIMEMMYDRGMNFGDVDIRFTGHSLGGALASYSVAKFKAYHPEARVSSFTACAPRVFSRSAAEAVDALVGKDSQVRLWKWMDVVPAIVSNGLGYRHTGVSASLNSDSYTNLLVNHDVTSLYTTACAKNATVTFGRQGAVTSARNGLDRVLGELHASAVVNAATSAGYAIGDVAGEALDVASKVVSGTYGAVSAVAGGTYGAVSAVAGGTYGAVSSAVSWLGGFWSK